MFMQNQFVWVDIPVSDLDRAIAFYSAVLGEKLKKESAQDFVFGVFPHADYSYIRTNGAKCSYVLCTDKDVIRASCSSPAAWSNLAPATTSRPKQAR